MEFDKKEFSIRMRASTIQFENACRNFINSEQHKKMIKSFENLGASIRTSLKQ